MTLHILGIGSPAGDDQAGWLVVDALRARGVEAGGRAVLAKLDRPGASLLTTLEGVDRVILVDALQSGGTPGEIHRWTQADWATTGADLSSHGFGVLAALALAQALGSLPQQVEVVGIEIASSELGARVSPAVRQAVEQLAAHLADV